MKLHPTSLSGCWRTIICWVSTARQSVSPIVRWLPGQVFVGHLDSVQSGTHHTPGSCTPDIPSRNSSAPLWTRLSICADSRHNGRREFSPHYRKLMVLAIASVPVICGMVSNGESSVVRADLATILSSRFLSRSNTVFLTLCPAMVHSFLLVSLNGGIIRVQIASNPSI